MADSIRPLTPSDIRAAAEAAAHQRIPHAEANDFPPGSEQWRTFARAYADALPPVTEAA
ncbi:hypothetical protein [Ottowia sp. VDI28]|uniref:hypothetical protein n=1 Tax=Ottowia sp. VDI28 TaxID=3133968 RepID=UPI003C2BA58E